MGTASHFAELYWMFVDPSDRFLIKARDKTGKRISTELAGITALERKQNRNPINARMNVARTNLNWASGNEGLRFLEDPSIAEIRLKYFVGGKFPEWIENSFKLLQQKGTKALIVDLRGNGGGQDMYGALFVSYLTDQPFRYFDRIHLRTITPSFKQYSGWGSDVERKLREGTVPSAPGGYLATTNLHPGLALQSPSKHPFLGKVFVLINGGTFSTAADVCAILHSLKRAIFIGEETGGGYYGNNSGMEPRVTLPNSGLHVRVPMFEYWNAVSGDEAERRGTRPEYVVPEKTADWLEGKDEPLETAVALARRGIRSN
jgi:C-terminal processing protease CtpA/Prc